MPSSSSYSPFERASEKQASRDADARDLAAGSKSRDQLRSENGFLVLPPSWTTGLARSRDSAA